MAAAQFVLGVDVGTTTVLYYTVLYCTVLYWLSVRYALNTTQYFYSIQVQ